MNRSNLFSLFTFLFISSSLFGQLSIPPSGANQRSEVIQYMGAIAFVRINYNSPDVTGPNGQDRKGQIWGQLVPFGLNDLGFGLRTPAPWRAGANENTTFTFSHDVLIEGKALKAGTYGFHIIVEETGPWTIIFSENTEAWGSYFYQEAEDVLRVKVTPKDGSFQEWLTYDFTDRQPNECTVAMKWENKSLPFNIKVDKAEELYVNTLRSELQSSLGFNYQNWVAAANYCVQNDVNLEEALVWAQTAIDGPFVGQENYGTLSTKAAVLAKLNRQAASDEVMEQAIKHATATSFQIHGYGRQLITQQKGEKALEIFQYNFDRFEGAWPTNVGMARGYSAIGNYKKAAEHAKVAHDQAPDPLNKGNLAKLIKQLESGKDIN